jgi:hypothetical protein
VPFSRWLNTGARLGAFLLVASLASLAVPSQAGTWDLRLNMQGVDYYFFSPNGDGYRDVARGFYRLEARADVDLQVRRADRVVATIAQGHKPAGSKVLRWDGTDGDGQVFRDGFYRLRIVARTSGGAVVRSNWVQVGVDTKIPDGRIRLREAAVYPQTPGVVDSLRFDYVAPTGQGLDWGNVRGRVMDATRTVVDRLGTEDPGGHLFCLPETGEWTRCGVHWSWTARHHGQALDPGIYRLQVIRRDVAGNRTQTGTWVRVSGDHLVAEQMSVTVSAEGSGHWCNENCGEYPNCGQVLPGRFGPGSLSYRSAEGDDQCYDFASASHRADVLDHDVAAFGEFRVTAYGGPTLPGAPDQGELLVGNPDLPVTSTGADTSDHETTSPWVHVDPWYGSTRSVSWSFQTRGTNSYDVAWFKVDFVVYQPPA